MGQWDKGPDIGLASGNMTTDGARQIFKPIGFANVVN